LIQLHFSRQGGHDFDMAKRVRTKPFNRKRNSGSRGAEAKAMGSRARQQDKAMPQQQFGAETFRYFDLAHKNRFNPDWFLRNRETYETHVRMPMESLVLKIAHSLGRQLERIDIEPSRVCRPVRPANRATELGAVKSFSHFTLWEKKTSLFEWNPGIHFQIGHKPDDCLAGVGLYMVSSRQLSRLREAVTSDTRTLEKHLRSRRMQTRWGELLGDRYKRFPKGYSEDQVGAEFLWHKQFYIGQQFNRKKVTSRGFADQLVEDLRIALPFFNWVRGAVGTYSERRGLDRN
jgi:uncharacterized protein (TIGR02453 family)